MAYEEITEKFKKEFLQEAREILETVSEDILKLEAAPSRTELLDALFRGIHTIKGSAGSYDLARITDFSHHLENLFNVLRNKEVELTPEVVDTILVAADSLTAMIETYEKGRVPDIDPELVERLQTCYKKSAASALTLETAPLPSNIRAVLESAIMEKQQAYKIYWAYADFSSGDMPDQARFMAELQDKCQNYFPVMGGTDIPGLDTFDPLKLYLQPVLYVSTSLSSDTIEDLNNGLGDNRVKELVIESIAAQSVASEEAADNDPVPDEMDEDTLPEFQMDMEEAMGEFLEGAFEMLEAAEQSIIEYETSGSDDSLNAIFRVVHNIKGDADFIGVRELTRFTHATESLIEKLRQKLIPATPETVDVILKSMDFIKHAISVLADGNPMPNLPLLYQQLLKYDDAGHKEAVTVCVPTLPKDIHDVFYEQVFQFEEILGICMDTSHSFADRKALAVQTLRDLTVCADTVGYKELSVKAADVWENWHDPELRSDNPDLLSGLEDVRSLLDQLLEESARLGEILIREKKIQEADLEEALSRQKVVGELLVDLGKVSEEDVALALKKQQVLESADRRKTQKNEDESGKSASIQSMRVDEKKIERFSNMVGEMLIARNRYAYLLDQLESADGDIRPTVRAMEENLHLFSRLTSEIQHSVVALRMVPIKGIFTKFVRVVRDISNKQKKSIQLMTDGEEIEIDKKVADVLTDPMIHLVRNACDHGIETGKERETQGKPQKGTLLLRAVKQGSSIIIDIIDDGKGIDREKLFKKAREKGFKIDAKDDPGLLDLIFMPGISTADEVTDISGRGVGMDVVKTTVRSLGGTINLMSDQGKGTQVTLSIPTTLGIDTVLFIEAAGNSYALPIECILSTVKLAPEKFRQAGDALVFYYRGEVLPAVHLQEIISKKIPGSAGSQINKTGEQEWACVILKNAGGKFGLIIDRFDKNMEIAVKPLPEMLSGINIVSGVSILGDGRVLLVLNPEHLTA
ncbi:chemotaxis protein CheA [Desulfobacter latus]|uniref:Chemotaxis protein CheA n=1 Tax=Desulfobacter latus TaxID=2292 RepID=A0A850SVH7_9BACT|nr:chemotaxis protein CheA [Desulfobacter latus]NWH05159.1 chemotaxis protein CheA [Desulfobacter latus]